MANREPIEEIWMGDQTKYVCPECLLFDSLEKPKVEEHIRVKHPISIVDEFNAAEARMEAERAEKAAKLEAEKAAKLEAEKAARLKAEKAAKSGDKVNA